MAVILKFGDRRSSLLPLDLTFKDSHWIGEPPCLHEAKACLRMEPARQREREKMMTLFEPQNKFCLKLHLLLDFLVR